jgi:hypothetical protein
MPGGKERAYRRILRLFSTSSVALYSGGFATIGLAWGMMLTLDQAGARHSQSPMKAEGVAVIAGACAFDVRKATPIRSVQVTMLF